MSQFTDVAGREVPALKLAKAEPAPRHNPDPLYCSYYVSRKHRFCHTECKPGSLYCCTHDSGTTAPSAGAKVDSEAQSSPPSVASAAGVRVPCPINPNHTVYASRLEKHMKVCPDLRFVTTQLPYFCADKHANKGAVFAAPMPAKEGNREDTHATRRTHRDLSHDDLVRLMDKIAECYRTCVEPDVVVLPSCATATDAATAGLKSKEEASAPSSSVPPASASSPAPSSPSHSETTSQKHGPQYTALLRCLSDLVLQSRAADSILTLYSSLTAGREGALKAAAPPIHVDGFLEFGAGKGGLSIALQQLIVQHARNDDAEADNTAVATSAADTAAGPLTSSSSFLNEVAARPPLVVLDFDGFRRKGDARVRHSAVPLRRLRINIKDVDLTQAFLTDIRPRIPASSDKTSNDTGMQTKGEPAVPSRGVGDDGGMQNWAVLGKHLCGACTDFALSCLTEAPSLAHAARVRLPIVVIATCCHHRCELRHLNPPEPSTNANMEAAPAVLAMPGSAFTWSCEEFAAMTSMTSWAVCGGFVDEARRQVGWQCKRIIDQLRVHFLRQLGYVAFQCQYTARDVTEENICIVAFQSPA